MAVERFVIVRFTPGETTGTVVDTIKADTDPASDNHEILFDTPNDRFIRSDDAQLGWTWTEEGGLKAGE